MTAVPPIVRVYLHFRWPVSPHGAPLTAAALARLSPYVTRYAQTLQATVFAVGGAADHLHVLLLLPPTRTLNEIANELRAASARYVCDVLKVPEFAWHNADAGFVESVGVDAPDTLGDYIRQNWERHAGGTMMPYWESIQSENDPAGDADAPIPQWLQNALNKEKR